MPHARFENEFGRSIYVETKLEDPAEGGVRHVVIDMRGPSSQHENRITKHEALILLHLLAASLNAKVIDGDTAKRLPPHLLNPRRRRR